MGKIIFVTGTDTGVGKTLFTALWLLHLRKEGKEAVAIKPFCSGSRAEAKLLWDLQERRLPLNVVNPFFFREPVAPLIAARRNRRKTAMRDVLDHIQACAAQSEILLVEGCGGLLVPLDEEYSVADVIRALSGDIVVVARNKLGVINHTLLTVRELQRQKKRELTVVLMGDRKNNLATKTNGPVLRELLSSMEVEVYEVPFLGNHMDDSENILRKLEKAKPHLTKVTKLLTNIR